MSKTAERIVNGVVTGSVFGLCTNIAYQDGCQRPGDKNLVKDSIVVSEASTQNGICEHVILQVIEPKAAEIEKPQPVRKTVTVDQIVKAAEQRKQSPQPKAPRLALSKEDAPVDEATIARAKIPPRIKSNPATAPAQNTAATPIENQFDGDITGLTPEEIAELRGGPSVESDVGGGAPANPFSTGFDPRTATPVKPPGRW